MSVLRKTHYDLKASDTCSTALAQSKTIALSTLLTAEVSDSSRRVSGLKIVGSNSNHVDMGSAEIKLDESRLSSLDAFNSDWLRAVARMFNHLADNMDRLPTHEQTIATMVANKLE